MKSLRAGCDDKLLVMVTPRILREVEQEIPETGEGRVALSFLSFFIDKNDFNGFTAAHS